MPTTVDLGPIFKGCPSVHGNSTIKQLDITLFKSNFCVQVLANCLPDFDSLYLFRSDIGRVWKKVSFFNVFWTTGRTKITLQKI